MKGFLFCMFLVFGALLTGPVLEASAQFPMPPAKSPTMTATAPVVAAPQIVAVPAAAPAGWSFENIMDLIKTAIGGLIAGLLAKIGIWPAATRVLPEDAPVSDPLSALVAKAKDPRAKELLDGLIARAADSDLIRSGVRTGLGMVPVAGSILSQLEPGLNALVKKAIAENVPPAAP